MRVAFVLPPIERYSPQSGGAIATVVMQQAKRLSCSGHEVAVLGPDHPDVIYPVGQWWPICGLAGGTRIGLHRRVLTRLRRGMNDWPWPAYDRYLADARRGLRRIEPDVVVCFNDFDIPTAIRKWFPYAGLVLRLSNEIVRPDAIGQAGLAACDAVVPVSRYILNWTRKRYGKWAGATEVIPNGSDPTTFFPRDAFDQPSERLKVLFIGRIDPNKGPDLAADAVATLRQEGVAIDLTVAGGRWFYGEHEPNEYERTLASKIDSAGGTMLGHLSRDDLPAVVRDHDVLLMLSRSEEPMGQTQFEAMASGLAVIGTLRGGIPEACGNACPLVEPEDSERVAAILRNWAGNSDDLIRAKRRCLARGLYMTWDRNAEAMEQALRNAMRPNRRTTAT